MKLTIRKRKNKMIQYNEITKTYRARWDYGHNSYYKSLLRNKKSLTKDYKSEEKMPVSIRTSYEKVITEIARLESKYGKPVNIKTRRSFCTRHQWQAVQAEELFKAAYELEAAGKTIPRLLHAQLNSLSEAPKREDFLEELGFQFASIGGFHEEVLANSDYEMFLAQSDANTDWIINMRISEKEVRAKAQAICSNKINLDLKNKKYIFTGSFISYTACEDYVKCLEKMALHLKVDGIITAGPWIKYIFLHKTAGSQKILDSVKSLTSKVPVYAIRSNQEDADLITLLKDIGVTFVNKIEDEKNLFLNHQFGRTSNKDQLQKFRDYHVDKNLFVHCTYVASEPKLVVDHTRFIIGSGSASYHTPGARIWANSYDSQHINSEKYDEIGGHLLWFDEQSELYPMQFYYNEKVKGIFCGGKVYKKQQGFDANLHMIISDGHFSGVHKKGYTAAKQFIKNNRKQIASFILNGDIFDNAVLCHWNDGNYLKQFKIKEKHKSFIHEVAKTRVMIKELVNLVTDNGKRKIKLIYKMGNHENSSFKKLESKSIVHFLSNMLDLKPLLELDKLEFEIVPADKPYFVGQVPILHGHEMQRAQAHRTFGRLVTIGHSHRGSTDAIGVILPTLEDQDHVEYLTYFKRPWIVGWGVISELQGVTEKTVNHIVYKDKFVDLDGVKKIEKPEEIVLPKELTVTYSL